MTRRLVRPPTAAVAATAAASAAVRGVALLALLAGLGFGAAGCPGPEYPNCKKDEDCKDHDEFCVKGKCVACRDAKDCKPGEECKGGRCEKPEGACTTTSDCPSGEKCKDGKCKKECESSDECPAGYECKKGKCVATSECSADADCPPGSGCVSGKCRALSSTGPTVGADCTLQPVYFGLDSDELTDSALEALKADAECINFPANAGKAVVVEGHCDPRGTDEYNLALSDRRGSGVKSYLIKLGVDASRLTVFPKGEEESSGTDEGTWKLDRKAVINWK
jgi:peptidoglycan-associated lipoprotein